MLELPKDFSIGHLESLRSFILMMKGHYGSWSKLLKYNITDRDLSHFVDGGRLNFARGDKSNVKIRAIYNIVHEYFKEFPERKKSILPVWTRIYSQATTKDTFVFEPFYTDFAESDQYYKDLALAYCGTFVAHKRGSGRKSEGEVVRSILKIEHTPQSKCGFSFEWRYPVRNYHDNSKITGDFIVGPKHIYLIGYDHGSFAPTMFITPTPPLDRQLATNKGITQMDGVSLRSSTNGTIVAARAHCIRTTLEWDNIQSLVDIYSTSQFISLSKDANMIIKKITNFDNGEYDFILRGYER